MAEADVAKVDRVGQIENSLKVIGTLIAALIAFGTLLHNCTEQSIARHAALKQAVDAEEAFWRDRFTEYAAVFGPQVQDPERRARLFLISALAQREVPDFEEYSTGLFDDGSARNVARERLIRLRDRLNHALSQPESSHPDVVAQRQELEFSAAQATLTRQRDATAGPAAAQPSPAPSSPPTIAEGVNYATQLLSAGDREGWDIDVFWCRGGGSLAEAANYGEGLSAARSLAALSSNSERLGGEKLGRVRLIALPLSRQRNVGNLPAAGDGFQIRPERRDDEVRLANALRQRVQRPGEPIGFITSDTPTRWYLSVFACRARPADQQAPQPPAAAANAS